MKKILLISVLLVPSLAFGFWGKGKGKHKKGMDPAKKVERLSKQLSLSEEQKVKVLAIQTEAQSKNKTLRKETLSKLRGEMKELMESGAPEATLRSKHQEIESVQSQIRTNRFDSMLQIRAQLNPEQKKKFSKMRQKFEKKFKRGKGKKR
jgi:Spy/CpxP family protein refolding chaperone